MPSTNEPKWQRALAAAVGKPWFWALLVGTLFCLPLARSMLRPLPPAQPVLGEVPAEETRLFNGEHAGSGFDLGALRGKVWAATFIDPGDPQCEQLADVLTRTQRRARNLGDDYRLVSFVPPGADPTAVAAFAARHHANPLRWMFLALPAPVETTMIRAMQNAGLLAPSMAITGQVHGRHLAILVDRHARVRGFYEVLTKPGLDSLLADLGLDANLDR